MTTRHATNWEIRSLMGQATPPPSALFGDTDADLWHYRSRTVALLRRYGRASVEVGRLPSLVGRGCFRARLTSYSMSSFEDVVIFVTDMEQALRRLGERDKQLLAMHVLEEYSVAEVARLLGLPQSTVHRQLQEALDRLSSQLLATGLLERLPGLTM